MGVKIPRWPAAVKFSYFFTNEVGMPYCNNKIIESSALFKDYALLY